MIHRPAHGCMPQPDRYGKLSADTRCRTLEIALPDASWWPDESPGPPPPPLHPTGEAGEGSPWQGIGCSAQCRRTDSPAWRASIRDTSFPGIESTLMANATKKVVYAALLGNLLVAIAKFVAAGISGSAAMLSEGVHSLVDTGNEGLLLYGMKRAKEPADERFPFGHGKEIYFWSFVVALLVFSLGAGVSLYEGIEHLRNPQPVEDPLINYIVIGLAILFEGYSWSVAVKEFSQAKGARGYVDAIRRGKDPTMFAVLFEDTAALLGLVVALASVILGDVTGNPYFDGAASVIIGLILAVTAFWLGRETKGLLIGESANSEVVTGIRTLIRSNPEIERVNEILTMHMGPDFILVNISLRVVSHADRASVHSVYENIDDSIKTTFPKVKRVFIEAERDSKTDGPEKVPLPDANSPAKS